MKTILFLHDTSLATPRGAELTIKELMFLGESKGYTVLLDYLTDFEKTQGNILKADLIVLNSTSRCHFETGLLEQLVDQPIPYIKVEYDYNFCIRRNIFCTVDPNIRSCCNTDKFHLFRKLFAGAALNIFQSPKHYRSHYDFYGQAISKHLIMPPTVNVDKLKTDLEKTDDTIPFFGDLNFLKGGHEYVTQAERNPSEKYTVYGRNRLRREMPENIRFHDPVSNEEVLEILARTKKIICKPVWPEPSGRLAAEAFLSGCEILSNNRVGTFSFDFYPSDKERAKAEMKQAPENFWNSVTNILNVPAQSNAKSLGKVLVYKSYGGLGDIFFAIPAIYKIAQVSDELHFAVSPRLMPFFTKHLTQVKVVNEVEARNNEAAYDAIYELGNYPAFRGYDLAHALKYPTHKRVKQHAIQHYIDTVAKLHIDIDNHLERYPYFEQKIDPTKKYFVIHHGAGFLLKIWPTDKYAQLIEKLSNFFPGLDCKIIMGPNDPAILPYFTKEMPHVSYVTGDMSEVGEAMSGALFHIGNDAGITHVAGSFNVPTVGIYGPTGPGSWGSFSQHNELIWGKKGTCNLKCNYDVILNCSHRICLTSITVDRVLEALYKVLQKAYPTITSKIVVNPQAQFEFGAMECIIKLGDNQLLLEYHSPEMKKSVEDLLTTETSLQNLNGDMEKVVEVLIQQSVIFKAPAFK